MAHTIIRQLAKLIVERILTVEDVKTEQHAQILAHDYNLAPNVTKCERAIQVETDVNTMFLANSTGTVRCLVKYNADDLVFP